MSYKILTLGARGNILCQLNRIDKGLKSLGHELTDINPDIIYVNDAGYHLEGIELKKKYPNAKLILNILDIPFHCKEVRDIIANLNNNFYSADIVTTISETVRLQMINIFPQLQKRGIPIIYQPIKPVRPLNLERNSNLLAIGRQNDPNKRFNIALELAVFTGRIINVVGPEDPSNILPPNKLHYKKYINYLGVLSDEDLNIQYNTCAAVLITSKWEGLNLPLIESLSCKTPVVCCEDMSTSLEFCPSEFICRASLYDMSEKLSYIINKNISLEKILIDTSIKYLDIFCDKSIANNILNTIKN
jgi:glycosyltransferase involved in cell wall biosynthesis